jgi:hypothetical protein
MPNRSELPFTARPKAALAKAHCVYDDGIWFVAGLCVVGALLSIDCAAYFQVLDQLPMLVSQVP